MRNREHYDMWFDPAMNDVWFVIDTFNHIPQMKGFVEVSHLPSATEEERQLFMMLYPGADAIKVDAAIEIWNNLEGKLNFPVYSRERIDIEIRKGSLVYNPPR